MENRVDRRKNAGNNTENSCWILAERPGDVLQHEDFVLGVRKRAVCSGGYGQSEQETLVRANCPARGIRDRVRCLGRLPKLTKHPLFSFLSKKGRKNQRVSRNHSCRQASNRKEKNARRGAYVISYGTRRERKRNRYGRKREKLEKTDCRDGVGGCAFAGRSGPIGLGKRAGIGRGNACTGNGGLEPPGCDSGNCCPDVAGRQVDRRSAGDGRCHASALYMALDAERQGSVGECRRAGGRSAQSVR